MTNHLWTSHIYHASCAIKKVGITGTEPQVLQVQCVKFVISKLFIF